MDDQRDAYRDAAFICCMLTCDICWPRHGCETLEVEELGLTYSDQDWDKALADEARKRGWRVEFADTDTGFLVLCPHCARRDAATSSTT